jgi:hypothetical protein
MVRRRKKLVRKIDGPLGEKIAGKLLILLLRAWVQIKVNLFPIISSKRKASGF